jgi:protein subunit release factor B
MFPYGDLSSLRFSSTMCPTDQVILSQPVLRDFTQLRVMDVPRNCLKFKFSRSSGPGGQNVNKVNTKAELRLRLASSETISWLPDNVREELRKISANRINQDHELVLHCDTFRSQMENRNACIEKLTHLIRCAAESAKGPKDPSLHTRQRIHQL